MRRAYISLIMQHSSNLFQNPLKRCALMWQARQGSAVSSMDIVEWCITSHPSSQNITLKVSAWDQKFIFYSGYSVGFMNCELSFQVLLGKHVLNKCHIHTSCAFFILICFVWCKSNNIKMTRQFQIILLILSSWSSCRGLYSFLLWQHAAILLPSIMMGIQTDPTG